MGDDGTRDEDRDANGDRRRGRGQGPDALGRLDSKGRVTIPKQIRENLRLSEGDTVLFRVTGGRLEAIPMTMVPRDQSWFYHRSVQRRVAEALRDVREGRTRRVESRRELEEEFGAPGGAP